MTRLGVPNTVSMVCLMHLNSLSHHWHIHILQPTKFDKIQVKMFFSQDTAKIFIFLFLPQLPINIFITTTNTCKDNFVMIEPFTTNSKRTFLLHFWISFSQFIFIIVF